MVSELTVIGDVAPLLNSVAPPSLEMHVTVWEVMALPPSAPVVKATLTALRPRVIPVTVGALGTDSAVKLEDAADAALVPMGLVAVAVQVYVSPLVSEPTVTG